MTAVGTVLGEAEVTGQVAGPLRLSKVLILTQKQRGTEEDIKTFGQGVIQSARISAAGWRSYQENAGKPAGRLLLELTGLGSLLATW